MLSIELINPGQTVCSFPEYLLSYRLAVGDSYSQYILKIYQKPKFWGFLFCQVQNIQNNLYMRISSASKLALPELLITLSCAQVSPG